MRVLGISSHVCPKWFHKDRVVFVLALPEMKAFIRTALGTFTLARRLSFQGKETFWLDLVVFALV